MPGARLLRLLNNDRSCLCHPSLRGWYYYVFTKSWRSGQRLRIVVLSEVPEDPSLLRQWNALVQRIDRPQVFYSYEWSLAVQRAYSPVLSPLIFLGYDDQENL